MCRGARDRGPQMAGASKARDPFSSAGLEEEGRASGGGEARRPEFGKSCS